MTDARQTSTVAGQEIRRARRAIRISLEMLREPGPDVRIADVAHLAGFSRWKVIADIESGHLVANRADCGTRWQRRIDRREALRYLGTLRRAYVPRGTV